MLHRKPDVPPIVTAQWLSDHLEEVALADVRWFLDGTDARTAYQREHLPGAVFVDLDRDLAAPPTPEAGRHPLPTPRHFAQAMSRLGIPSDATIVAYDQDHGGYAARLVWMLRITGHEAALLEGGLAGWPGDTESGESLRAPTDFPARPWPLEWLADLEEVAELSRGLLDGPTGDTALVDARAGERYRGEVEPVDPRPGHVPGAVSVPFTDQLGPDGRLRARDERREAFDRAGVLQAEDVVVYCGSGVTACHDLLVLEDLGVQARLFPGSWSQWSTHQELPAATGERPEGEPA